MNKEVGSLAENFKYVVDSGTISLPLAVPTSVKSLVVPNLHELLLSVAALCNKHIMVILIPSHTISIGQTTSTSTAPLLVKGTVEGISTIFL